MKFRTPTTQAYRGTCNYGDAGPNRKHQRAYTSIDSSWIGDKRDFQNSSTGRGTVLLTLIMDGRSGQPLKKQKTYLRLVRMWRWRSGMSRLTKISSCKMRSHIPSSSGNPLSRLHGWRQRSLITERLLRKYGQFLTLPTNHERNKRELLSQTKMDF